MFDYIIFGRVHDLFVILNQSRPALNVSTFNSFFYMYTKF